jgi:hypothetical protein
VVVEAAGNVLSIWRVDGLGHVQNLWLPGILPARLGPEQTLISNAEHHKIYQQYYNHISPSTIYICDGGGVVKLGNKGRSRYMDWEWIWGVY